MMSNYKTSLWFFTLIFFCHQIWCQVQEVSATGSLGKPDSNTIEHINTLAQDTIGDTFQLYFLGGQSNMEGFGYNEHLPGSMKGPLENALIFQGNPVPDNDPKGGLGIWAPLQPGHGTGFSSDGQQNDYSDRFGPELSFAHQLLELEPGVKIAIIKYSRGGSSLQEGASGYGTWAPGFSDGNGINQYDNFLTTLTNALNISDINRDGKPDRLIPAGIIWMQGESDAAHNEGTARNYEKNLTMIMDLFRAALRKDDLPVVIGQISDSGMDDDGKLMDYSDIVIKAQKVRTLMQHWLPVPRTMSF